MTATILSKPTTRTEKDPYTTWTIRTYQTGQAKAGLPTAGNSPKRGGESDWVILAGRHVHTGQLTLSLAVARTGAALTRFGSRASDPTAAPEEWAAVTAALAELGFERQADHWTHPEVNGQIIDLQVRSTGIVSAQANGAKEWIEIVAPETVATIAGGLVAANGRL